MRVLRSIGNMFRSIFCRRRRGDKLSAVEHGAINRVLELIRGSTHPKLKDPGRWRRCNAVPGTRKIGPLWSLKNPWGSGWVRGWYCPSTEQPSVVVDPANPTDIPVCTLEHEYAHHVEWRKKIAPPWHYPAWRRLFADWYGSRSGRTDATHCLPGVPCGCIVILDLVELDDPPADPSQGQTHRRQGTTRVAGRSAQRPCGGEADQPKEG